MRGLFSEMKWRKTEELHNHSTDKPLDPKNGWVGRVNKINHNHNHKYKK